MLEYKNYILLNYILLIIHYLRFIMVFTVQVEKKTSCLTDAIRINEIHVKGKTRIGSSWEVQKPIRASPVKRLYELIKKNPNKLAVQLMT